MSKFNIKTKVIISGFDRYHCVWPTFEYGFNKYWPDCPYEKKFITETLDCPKSFDNIKVGKKDSWGSMAREGIALSGSDIIIWILDDYWITGKINTEVIKKYVGIIENTDVEHIRLLPPSNENGEVIPTLECSQELVSDLKLWTFKDDAEFKASLTIGIWKQQTFLNSIHDGMTPWDFEQQASKDAKGSNKYLCCVDPYVFPMAWRSNPYNEVKGNIVRNGLWTEHARKYSEIEGLDVDFSVHPNGRKTFWLK